MNWGINPAITFDKSLEVGQEIEARLVNCDRVFRFAARIVVLDEKTARVEALEDGVNDRPKGEEFVIPRFSSPMWSRNSGLFPLHRSA